MQMTSVDKVRPEGVDLPSNTKSGQITKPFDKENPPSRRV